jgi:hypothetical protein
VGFVVFCGSGTGFCLNTLFFPLSITNKMQRYTIFFTAVNTLHVSGGFSAHHQELKLYIQHLVYAATASVGELALPTYPR